MSAFGVGLSSLVVLALFLVWWRLNRSLGLVGSALAGALLMSGVVDAFLAWGSGEKALVWLLPLILPLFAVILLWAPWTFPSRRWVSFGVVSMFVLRLIVAAPTHSAWSGRLSGSVRDWLLMAGLDPSLSVREPEAPPAFLGDVEMPCGLGRFRVKSDDLKPSTAGLRLRVEPCGFTPLAFAARGVSTLEISNALSIALELAFAPQGEGSETVAPWSIVVPPESSVEVTDFRVPVGGAVLVYAPLEAHLGAVFVADPRVAGEYWVSRRPLSLVRQTFDAP